MMSTKRWEILFFTIIGLYLIIGFYKKIPKAITTISSTGIDIIEPLFSKVAKFGVKYEQDFSWQ